MLSVKYTILSYKNPIQKTKWLKQILCVRVRGRLSSHIMLWGHGGWIERIQRRWGNVLLDVQILNRLLLYGITLNLGYVGFCSLTCLLCGQKQQKTRKVYPSYFVHSLSFPDTMNSFGEFGDLLIAKKYLSESQKYYCCWALVSFLETFHF